MLYQYNHQEKNPGSREKIWKKIQDQEKKSLKNLNQEKNPRNQRKKSGESED